MIRWTVRGLAARWWRAAMTSLAAVVGVAMVSGTLMVSDTADALGVHDPNLDIVRIVMLLAGGVALLVGAFTVNLTVSVTVAQRTRELGLLRCLGADVRQVRRAVMLEGLVVGVLGSAVGLVGGYGVATALRAFINTSVFPGDLPGQSFVVSARTVLAALVVGCVVTVVSGLGPARRAGRVPPIAALRDLPRRTGGRHRIRTAIGVLCTATGIAAVPLAVATAAGPALLVGTVATLVGVRLLGPTVTTPLARIVGPPLARTGGVAGTLGWHNAVRNPERTAATATALMIGVALLTLVNVLFASTRAPMAAEHARDRADFELSAPVGDDEWGTPLSPDLERQLRELPEVATVVPVRCWTDKGSEDRLCGADPAVLSRVMDLDVVEGSVADVTAGGIGVNEASAEAGGWTIGTPLRFQGHTFTVRAIYRSLYTFSEFLISGADLDQLDTEPIALYVEGERGAVDRVVAAYPGVEVRDRDQRLGRELDQMSGAAAVYRTLTGLATLVGLFGVVNILALSIVERRREVGLLRAVGMQRRQVRTMIRAEAMTVVFVGTTLGLGLGLMYGWAAARVLEHSSMPTRFAVPVLAIALSTAVIAAAGLAAAALPARWAARIDVLRAIATE